MKLVIADKNLSSWSMRPWLVLKHAGIPFEEHLLLFGRADWRDAIAPLSPSRQVPALHDGGLVVWDSLAICEYLAERFPDARLWPDDAKERAVARAVACEMHSSFAALRRELPLDVTARSPRTISTEAESDVRRVQEIWSRARGPFLFGAFSIADAMFAPVVFRFRTYGIAVEGESARAWCDAMLSLPAMKQWERDAAAEVAGRREAKPEPPSPRSARDCFAVIFTSELAGAPEGYEETAARMVELASKEPGFLSVESARSEGGLGITVSYWDSLAAIRRWKDNAEHQLVQLRGRQSFYARYDVRVARVERHYRFPERG